jgi:hypothetical protein
LSIQARGHVEHLIDGVRTDHAGLAEQAIHRQLARGQARGMAAAAARAGGLRPDFTTTMGFF